MKVIVEVRLIPVWLWCLRARRDIILTRLLVLRFRWLRPLFRLGLLVLHHGARHRSWAAIAAVYTSPSRVNQGREKRADKEQCRKQKIPIKSVRFHTRWLFVFVFARLFRLHFDFGRACRRRKLKV